MRIFLVACLLALVLVPTATAADYRKCGNLNAVVGAIKARNIGCQKAVEIVAAHQKGVKRPAGFRCTPRRYEGGATWTCRKGTKRIKYSRAD